MSDDRQGYVPRGFTQEMRQAISDIKHQLSAVGDHLFHHDEQFERVFDALSPDNEPATESKLTTFDDLASLNAGQLRWASETVASKVVLIIAVLMLSNGQTVSDVLNEIDDGTFYDDLTPLNVRQEVQNAHESLVEWLRTFLSDRELLT